ncbi:MAG: hypothetical protein QNJ00_16310 [Woeseiaceae bacterium]|nr:hypothetical protein [Woeseiaceae bacterium]
MRYKRLSTWISIFVAIVFWFFESAVHFFGYGEPTFEVFPSEVDEIWMRSVIVVLIVTVGILADRQNKSDRLDVYRGMLGATHHILNNFLQKMMQIRHEAEQSEDFDKDVLDLFDQIIDDTTAQIEQLDNISNPSKSAIEDRYLPK